MLPHVESPELLLEMEAARIVMRWRGEVDRRIVCEFVHSGIECTIVLRPTTTIPLIDVAPPLTECQRDIMDVLRAAGRRLTRPQIIDALEAAEKIHGESTVAMAMPALARMGLIDPPVRGVRKGYAIK